MHNLVLLAALIKKKNALEREITALIDRPAQIGHIGEYIASCVFHIELEESATYKASDGRFRNGPLRGRTVNIKWYARLESLLDITPNALPDFYLVMTGPKSGAMSSRGRSRPWLIDAVFLFEALPLVDELRRSGVKMGIATSVRQHLWDRAEIYPVQRNSALSLSAEQRQSLALFGSGAAG